MQTYSYKSPKRLKASLREIWEVQTHTGAKKKKKHTLTGQHRALPPEWELLPDVVTEVGGACGATLMDSSGDVEYSPSAAGANLTQNTQTLGSFKVILLIHCAARVCVWMNLCVWPLEARKQKVDTFKTKEILL